MFGFWKVSGGSIGVSKTQPHLGHAQVFLRVCRELTATKIQCILLARSGRVGIGSASSLGKIGMGCRQSSLRLGPEMATVASSLGEGGLGVRRRWARLRALSSCCQTELGLRSLSLGVVVVIDSTGQTGLSFKLSLGWLGKVGVEKK